MVRDVDVFSQLLIEPEHFLVEITSIVGSTNSEEKLGIALTGLRKSDDKIICAGFLFSNELSYFVDSAFRRQGYGSEFVAKLCRIVMKTAIGHSNIRASVLRTNLQSRAILEKIGFTFVGLAHRENTLYPGKFSVLDYRLTHKL